MQLDHEKVIRGSVEDFKIPMYINLLIFKIAKFYLTSERFHKEKIEDITMRCLDYEKKYFQEKELNSKLNGELVKIRG